MRRSHSLIVDGLCVCALGSVCASSSCMAKTILYYTCQVCKNKRAHVWIIVVCLLILKMIFSMLFLSTLFLSCVCFFFKNPNLCRDLLFMICIYVSCLSIHPPMHMSVCLSVCMYVYLLTFNIVVSVVKLHFTPWPHSCKDWTENGWMFLENLNNKSRFLTVDKGWKANTHFLQNL